MSDIVPTPTTPATTFTPDQISSAREHWISIGLDPAKFDSAMAPADPAASNSPAPTPGAAPDAQDDRAGIEIMGADKMPRLSQAEAEEFAARMREHGMAEDKINEALAKDGYAPLTPDERTDDQREYDRAFPQPAPSDYHVNYHECTTETDVTALAATNREFTTWASDLALPAEIGTAVIEEALKVDATTSRMTEGARQLRVREQRAVFAGLVGGPEKIEEKLAMVRPLLEKNPAMRDRLHRTGALDSATVVIHLANHAERLAARGSH